MTEFVSSAEVAEIVQRFIDEHDAQHPLDESDSPYTGLNLVAELTGVSTRQLYRLLKQECAFVTLDLADRILTGLELNYHLAWMETTTSVRNQGKTYSEKEKEKHKRYREKNRDKINKRRRESYSRTTQPHTIGG